MKLSNCCGAETYEINQDVCPSCGEHCEVETVNEDEEADAKEISEKKTVTDMANSVFEASEKLRKLLAEKGSGFNELVK